MVLCASACGVCVCRARDTVLQRQGHRLQRSGGHCGVWRPLSALELRSALWRAPCGRSGVTGRQGPGGARFLQVCVCVSNILLQTKWTNKKAVATIPMDLSGRLSRTFPTKSILRIWYPTHVTHVDEAWALKKHVGGGDTTLISDTSFFFLFAGLVAMTTQHPHTHICSKLCVAHPKHQRKSVSTKFWNFEKTRSNFNFLFQMKQMICSYLIRGYNTFIKSAKTRYRREERRSQSRRSHALRRVFLCHRNPDGDKRPWCYTVTDSAISWEYCDIPSCVTPACE